MSPGISQIQVQEDVASRDAEKAEDVDQKEWKPSLHELLIMISLAIISLMIALDATIVVTSLSTIVTDLNGTATQGFWVGTSYLLSSAATMPFIAAISDIFGRPVCLLTSLGVFTIGTILCSVSKGLTLLLVGRTIQGIGGGGIIILGLVIFTDIVPLRYRSKYYGIIQGAWALGTCIGPVTGGAFAEHASWRWNFYICFPFCLIGFISIPWLLTLRPRTATLKEKLVRVDWIGGFIFISSSTAFLVAISWGGTMEPWGSFRTIVPLVLGVLGITATILWEIYGAKEPFLRHSLFYSKSSIATYWGSMIQGLLLYGQLYYIPLYFLAVKQASPIRTGTDLFPILVSLIPASVVVGIIVTRINAYRWAVWSGWVIITLATGLLILWDEHTKTAQWAVTLIILGVGHGLTLNAQNFSSQAICKPLDESSAAAMYAFLRSFGMALGVGLGGSVFQNVMKTKLVQLHLPVTIAYHSESYLKTLRALPAGSPLKAQVLQAYVAGLHGVYASMCGVAATALIASFLVKHYDMNKELETEHKLEGNRVSKMLNLGASSSRLPTRANTPPETTDQVDDSKAGSQTSS